MRKILSALTAGAFIAANLSAAPVAANETGKKCRGEIKEMCASADSREARRGCVKENFSKLSDDCQQFLTEMMKKRKARKAVEAETE